MRTSATITLVLTALLAFIASASTDSYEPRRSALKQPMVKEDTEWRKTHKMMKAKYSDFNIRNDEGVAFWVHSAAKMYGIEPKYLLAMIAKESSFKPKVRSRHGAIGLMQVMPLWGYSREELSDYRRNIMQGTSILASYRDSCGGMRCAIEAYNVGITAYKAGKRAPTYYKSVMSFVSRNPDRT